MARIDRKHGSRNLLRTCFLRTRLLMMLVLGVAACSHTQSALAQITSLNTGSFLGGSGDDDVQGTEIQSDGTIVLAANISDAAPGGLTPILLGGSTSTTPGAILRLSADGKTVLSVTRFATHVLDVALDGEDNIYVAAGPDGVFKLTAAADQILWQQSIANCTRVDAAPNGDNVAFSGSPGVDLGTLYVQDADGTPLGSFVPTVANGGSKKSYDVAIDGANGSVFVTGFRQDNLGASNPLQVSFLNCYDYTGLLKWSDYNFPRDASTSFLNNDLADTRGLKVSMGRDGNLYGAFMCAGGNHIFRHRPDDFTQSASIVGGDAYHQFYNTRSEHKTFFARFDPVTGAYLRGQQFTGRLPNGSGNTAWIEKGNIKADEQGRLYLVGICASTTWPWTFNPVPSGEYTGGTFVLIMSPDFTTRLFLGRVCSGGTLYDVAARTLNGYSSAHFVFGGEWGGPTLWTQDPIQSTPGGGKDGFFAVKMGEAGSLARPRPVPPIRHAR